MSERDPRRLRIGASGPGPGAGGERDPERAAVSIARSARARGTIDSVKVAITTDMRIWMR